MSNHAMMQQALQQMRDFIESSSHTEELIRALTTTIDNHSEVLNKQAVTVSGLATSMNRIEPLVDDLAKRVAALEGHADLEAVVRAIYKDVPYAEWDERVKAVLDDDGTTPTGEAG